jgi:hypothetical protein
MIKLKFIKKKGINHNISVSNKVSEIEIKQDEIDIEENKDITLTSINIENEDDITLSNKNNKNKKKGKNMNISEKIKEAENAIEFMSPEVKVVKKDKGLIERTESSKIIITEDNRQVLID